MTIFICEFVRSFVRPCVTSSYSGKLYEKLCVFESKKLYAFSTLKNFMLFSSTLSQILYYFCFP